MKRIHLLRVEDDVAAFSPMVEVARSRGLRIGFLDWSFEQAPAVPAPARGLMRHVKLEKGLATASKPMAGPPVLRDVLREYFSGCVLVLVRLADGSPEPGETATVPSLSLGPSTGDAVPTLHIRRTGEVPLDLVLGIDELVARLPRPRPFDP